MGRLFWKFFLFVCLAQLTAIFGVSAVFWLERQQDLAHWQAQHGAAAETGRPPPPGPDFGHSHPLLHEGPPPPPPPPPRPPHLPVVPLLAALVASFIFAVLLARYFSRPIRHLQSAFDAVAAGNLDVEIGSAMGRRRDELSDLGRHFDRMARQLQVLIDGQRRLLHDVSHELRSPLARLQAAVDIARQQPARQEASLLRIEQESVRMDRLVGELLTLSRLEAGVGGRRIEEIEMAELLAGIVADARFEAEARGVTVELVGACEVVVDGDGELLHRAIENVVRNAIKHTPAGERVTVLADPKLGEIWIAIKDGGPGVPESDMEAIFQPFFRSSQSKDKAGHGLGLAIARRVVASLGGRISGANRAEGGFCMEISLPARLPG